MAFDRVHHGYAPGTLVKKLLRPLLLPLLRRDPTEIATRAASFRINTEEGRALVSSLGSAFLGGYNAMIERPSIETVAEEGRAVTPHFRPFFFEGAAMGYLPRGYLFSECSKRTAERDLLGMDERYRYLYYVGLGFWFGMRHPRRPASLAGLASHIDPFYFPLCYDGYGFKTAFFDFPRTPSVWSLLERCPREHTAAFHQGFGRALFFVYKDDEEGYRHLQQRLPPERRSDFETGRSLALAFTGVDRPMSIARHLTSASDGEESAARLLGVTWALTCRAMNDPDYFDECLARAPSRTADLLRCLPALCRQALAESSDYQDWQTKTRERAVEAYSGVSKSVTTEASSGDLEGSNPMPSMPR